MMICPRYRRRSIAVACFLLAAAPANSFAQEAGIDKTKPAAGLPATGASEINESAFGGKADAAFGNDSKAAASSGKIGNRLSVADVGVPNDGSDPATVQFYFDRTPWRDVIRWVSEEADLALHVGELPTGSFSYTDPREFTHQEAIDRINLFLLPEGFTLIRSGRLLSVINLGDPRSMQQLDALAPLISADQLQDRLVHDVVKCIFPLGDIDAEDAVQELSVLNLMSTPEVLSKTNQLLITDTAGKLRNVQKVLEAFRFDELDNGTVVKSFPLQHVNAEDVLVVARPHLGLATDEMIGIDVSVSADLQGKSIFVTGVEDKVKLLEGLVQAIDQPKGLKSTSSGGAAVLANYVVEGGNVETVYNVLQTLLAGKEVRLSMDQDSSSVVALATPDVQMEIEQTVKQLQANDADFEIIPLKTADPYQVISLLEGLLDLPGPLDDPDEIDPDAPRIDADPGNMRLFVRAKRPMIEQIKKIVEGLDSAGPVSEESELRIFPLRGPRAERVLESAAKFWRGENPVVLYRSLDGPDSKPSERVLTDEISDTVASPPVAPTVDSRYQKWLTTNVHTTAPAIRCQVTPRGLLMQSDDSDALNRFEEHLRIVAGPVDSLAGAPVVFYLKYTKADDAVRTLSQLIEGGEVAAEVEAGTLVNGYVSSSTSGFFGSYVSSLGGTLTLTAGTLTVVADSRLNRLIAQGSSAEIEEIEGYLRIIDKDNSITDIETYGTSDVIELFNTKASDVAAAIREAFAGRVAASATPQANGKQGQQGGQQRQREGQEGRDDERDDDRKNSKKQAEPRSSGGQPVRDLEPKMTVAVHEPSNSLIVTAPRQLFEQVERLARSIDSRAAQTVEIVTPVNGEVFETVLQQFLGQPGTQRPTVKPRPEPNRQSERPTGNPFRDKRD